MKAVVTKTKDSAAARAEGHTGAMKRIALIEDDADIAYTIRLNLRKEKKYQVEHYISGIAALAAVQEKPFDLVILDLNLPDIDGLALCRELRRADETRKVPIIMLTARVEERDKLLGFEIGADDYITKPFSMRELLARVNAHLRRVAAFETSEEEIFKDGDLVRRPRPLRDDPRGQARSPDQEGVRPALAPDPQPQPGRHPGRDPGAALGLRRGSGDAHGGRAHPGPAPQARRPAHRDGGRPGLSLPRGSPTRRDRGTMRLRARFTALFAILAAATVVVLVLVSDTIVGRAVSERVAERLGRELEHLADDFSRAAPSEAERDAFLRTAARQLECRVTYIAPGRKGPRRFGPPAGRRVLHGESRRPRGGPRGGPERNGALAPPFADGAAADALRRTEAAGRQRPAAGGVVGAAGRGRARISLGHAAGDRGGMSRAVSHRLQRFPPVLRADRGAHEERRRDRSRRLRAGPAAGRERGGPAASHRPSSA